MSRDILFKEECYKIQGAVFEVYRNKGCGFLEAVYQECLEIEFRSQSIPFVSQPEVELEYRGKTLNQTYKTLLVGVLVTFGHPPMPHTKRIIL